MKCLNVEFGGKLAAQASEYNPAGSELLKEGDELHITKNAPAERGHSIVNYNRWVSNLFRKAGHP
jgi:hypothetical protein